MSMLTRCPECGTSFRITTDQLVTRQGKVRCGRCQHVFSALASLVHTRDPAPPTPASDSTILSTTALTAAPEGAAANAAAVNAVGPASVITLDADSSLMPLDSYSKPLEITLQPVGPLDENTGSGPYTGPPSHLNPETDADTTPPLARPLSELARAEAEDEREWQARKRKRMNILAGLGALLAVLLLAGQGAYFYRNQLAIWQPDTKPWLLLMCEKLACKLEIPLDPQAISIESSSLEADPADRNVLQLNALLRNRSGLPQKMPYLELTMIDAQDAPMARRVIKPEEYGARGAAPQLNADGEFQIKLAIDATQLKANGYRLYAFYP